MSGTGAGTGDRGYAVLIAAFTAVVDLAVVVAAFGVVGVLISRDPLEHDRSPLLVPGAVACSAFVVFALLALWGARLVRGRPRISVTGVVVTGLGAFLVYVLILAVMTVHGGVHPLFFSGAFLAQLASPFAITLGVVGILIAIGYQLVIAARYRDRGSIEWPWERDEDG